MFLVLPFPVFPLLLAGRPVGRFDREELLATVRRLEDDIRFARMGTTLYRCYAELADEDADRDPTDSPVADPGDGVRSQDDDD